MDLSVVVPTLNGREQLQSCLDSLAEHAPDAEVIVVNGPSADGTSGMVRDRDDVAVLVEIADRNLNVARNAGISAATGEVIALVGYDLAVEAGWVEAIETSLDDGAAVATGPTHRTMSVGMTTENEETATIGGREVTFFNGDNVAFTDDAIESLDGFDEYLQTGGARDASHRIAGLGGTVAWNGDMCVRGEFETDGGTVEHDWGWKYRALLYRLVKTYGIRPGVARQVIRQALSDGRTTTRAILIGEVGPSEWFRGLVETCKGFAVGTKDGLLARLRNRQQGHNPNGLSTRFDRAIRSYDWR